MQYNHKCPICGKTFFVGDHTNYVYKTRIKSEELMYFCSWKCFRVSEKERTHRNEKS